MQPIQGLNILQSEDDSYESPANAILRSLHFTAIDDRQDQISEAHKQTFQWIFDEDGSEFANWLKHEKGIFWINGKAGSGKSTLMKSIFQDPRTRRFLKTNSQEDDYILAGFFFHDRGTTIQKSQLGLLRSILHQILGQRRTLIKSACPERWKRVESHNTQYLARFAKNGHPGQAFIHDEWSRAELMRTLGHVLTQGPKIKTGSGSLDIFLLIDGLDEYEGDKDDITGLFKYLASISSETGNSSVKLCLSSRPWNVFQDAFGECRQFQLQDLTRKDIRSYVVETLKGTPRMKEIARADSSSAHQLMEDIVSKADGVFLWVRLVVKSLIDGLRNYDKIADLQKRLARFPPDLEPLYQRMLDDIEEFYLKDALRLFQIMQSSRRPPRTLSLWYTDEEFDDPSEIPLELVRLEVQLTRCHEVDGQLRSRCAGLLEIQFGRSDVTDEDAYLPTLERDRPRGRYEIVDSNVQYLHQTVKEYLRKPEVWSRLISRLPDYDFNPDVWLARSYLREIKELRGRPFETFIQKLGSPNHERGLVWIPLRELMHHLRGCDSVLQIRFFKRLDQMLTIENNELTFPPSALGVPPHLANKEWWSATHWAQWLNRVDKRTIQLTLSYGHWQSSLLSFAVSSGVTSFVVEASKDPRFEVNPPTSRPLLHYLFDECDMCSPMDTIPMAELLLQLGADPTRTFRDYPDESPVSAMDIAAQESTASDATRREVAAQILVLMKIHNRFHGNNQFVPSNPPYKLPRSRDSPQSLRDTLPPIAPKPPLSMISPPALLATTYQDDGGLKYELERNVALENAVPLPDSPHLYHRSERRNRVEPFISRPSKDQQQVQAPSSARTSKNNYVQRNKNTTRRSFLCCFRGD